MKKTVYYFCPFIIIPILFLTLTLLESMDVLRSIMPYLLFAVLFLFSAIIGVLSPTSRKFDYIMTTLIPISVLFSLFIALFFDKGCDGKAQLSLSHATNIEYYYSWLPIAAIMMVITFIASFKSVRNIVKNRSTPK